MTANVDAMVKEGIRAYRAGKKDEARTLWEKATEMDQFNEQAWLWLSAVVETEEDQRTCLENVLFINPNSEAAQKGLAALDGKAKKAAASSALPTSSASSAFAGQEPSTSEYDDWVTNLPLANEGGSSGAATSKPFSTDIDLFDEDAFSDPFGTDFSSQVAETGTPTTAASVRAAFAPDAADDTDEDIFGNPFGGDDLASGPFSAGALDFDLDEEAASAPARSAAPVLPSRPSPISPASPRSTPTRSPSGGESRYYAGDDVAPEDELDPGEYFNMIPKAIKATHLPGLRETYPPLVIIGLVLLVVLNLAALGMLVLGMAG